jgi:hypothetical protein
VPMDAVVEFKRGVYQKALEELAPLLRRRHGKRRPLHARRAPNPIERE